jgi:hypothetical protein
MNDITISCSSDITAATPFANSVPKTANDSMEPCPWCGLYHIGVCSLVESIEFFSNGQLKRIKFRYQAMHWETFLLPRSVP